MRLIAGKDTNEPIVRFHLETDNVSNEVDVVATYPDGSTSAIMSFSECEHDARIGFHSYVLTAEDKKYFAPAKNGRLSYVDHS